jgi:hypothetical protein
MDTTTSLTMDAIERSLTDGEATIARVRRSQMVLIREADRRQEPTADGCRSMAEWVTGRLDVAPETAKTLVSTARRLESLPTADNSTDPQSTHHPGASDGAPGSAIQPTYACPRTQTIMSPCP